MLHNKAVLTIFVTIVVIVIKNLLENSRGTWSTIKVKGES